MKKSYAKKYLDPRWQQFRLKRLEMANWQCETCGDSTSKLNIHHAFYISGRQPWEYLLETTTVVCDACHEINHEFQSDFEALGASGWEYVAGQAMAAYRVHGKIENADLEIT
jgi:hypothetical protein